MGTKKQVRPGRNRKTDSDRGSPGTRKSSATDPPRVGRARSGFEAILEEEETRHDKFVTALKSSHIDLENTHAELEAAYAELEASHAELRAALADRNEAYQRLAESDAASQELIDAAAQGVLAVDSGERIVRVNRVLCSMFGYARQELLGKKLSLLVPKGSRRQHARDLDGFFQNPQRRVMGVGRVLLGQRKDGELFPIEVGLSTVELDHSRLAVAFISDVSESRRSQQELQVSRDRLRQLTRRITTAAETQNRKWARELHDVYSQQLVSIGMELSRAASDSGGNEQLRSLEEKVGILARDIHKFSRGLHPGIVHDLGLVAALKAEVAQFERHWGITTKLEVRKVPAGMPDEIALCLYRVTQESLRNVHKHSKTHDVRIVLSGTTRYLNLTIKDTGDGFELDRALRKGGLGLISMEERVLAVGGDFSVESTPGEGTTVRVKVPVAPAAKHGRS